MNYTPSVADQEHRELLTKAASNTASLAVLVEPQATLNPAQRKAVKLLACACKDVGKLFGRPNRSTVV